MLDRIVKRIARRNATAVMRFASRHPRQVAGMAGFAGMVVLGSTLALFGRRRDSRSSPGRPPVDGPAEPTRAQLYDEARRRDIRGRSGMSKEELKEALSAS